jgi:hypothetical protein
MIVPHGLMKGWLLQRGTMVRRPAVRTGLQGAGVPQDCRSVNVVPQRLG